MVRELEGGQKILTIPKDIGLKKDDYIKFTDNNGKIKMEKVK